MNKKPVFLLALLCLFGTSLLTAATFPNLDNDPLIVRTESDDDGITLLLANLEGVATSIQLKSLDAHEVVFQDMVRNHNGFSFDFALEELPYGRYLLTVKKEDTVKQQVILIGEHGVWLSQIK